MRCWFCVAFELQPNATIEPEQSPFSKARFRDLAGSRLQKLPLNASRSKASCLAGRLFDRISLCLPANPNPVRNEHGSGKTWLHCERVGI